MIMDIFEQMESCHVIEVNNIITDNFSFDSDLEDGDVGWLSIIIRTEDGDAERWYSYTELSDAKEHGNGFLVGKLSDVVSFYTLKPMSVG